MSVVVERLDDIGKPAWIALMILGFVLYWPVGLVLLAYLLWSGRMGCWSRGRRAYWRDGNREHRNDDRLQRWYERHAPPSSGNRAFDDYRADTLRRLEDEQRAFAEFLDRLRFAKDKAEFDAFLAERRERPAPPTQA